MLYQALCTVERRAQRSRSLLNCAQTVRRGPCRREKHCASGSHFHGSYMAKAYVAGWLKWHIATYRSEKKQQALAKNVRTPSAIAFIL